jgi:hypothetical protein
METLAPTETTQIEILINEGFGNVRFGQTMEEIRVALGDPEETEMHDEDEETDVVIWHYWERGYSVFFEQEAGFHFSCSEINNPETILWGQKIFTLNKDQIKSLFEEKTYKEIENEVHEWGEERLSIIDAMIDFYFEGTKLVSINFGKLLY